MSAESVVTSPLRAMNEVLAFEISSPSTSAVIVATTAIETETRLFVSSFRWCVGRRCRAPQPANALPASTAKMMKPMLGGESVIGTRHSMMTERSSYRLSAALVDPSQGRKRYRASYRDNFGLGQNAARNRCCESNPVVRLCSLEGLFSALCGSSCSRSAASGFASIPDLDPARSVGRGEVESGVPRSRPRINDMSAISPESDLGHFELGHESRRASALSFGFSSSPFAFPCLLSMSVASLACRSLTVFRAIYYADPAMV